jgi:hypothetical protein
MEDLHRDEADDDEEDFQYSKSEKDEFDSDFTDPSSSDSPKEENAQKAVKSKFIIKEKITNKNSQKYSSSKFIINKVHETIKVPEIIPAKEATNNKLEVKEPPTKQQKKEKPLLKKRYIHEFLS